MEDFSSAEMTYSPSRPGTHGPWVGPVGRPAWTHRPTGRCRRWPNAPPGPRHRWIGARWRRAAAPRAHPRRRTSRLLALDSSCPLFAVGSREWTSASRFGLDLSDRGVEPVGSAAGTGHL